MSNTGVNWNYRDVDVDQESSLLAMTEDIRYMDGNQYGYVRFYDLQIPCLPPSSGREKALRGLHRRSHENQPHPRKSEQFCLHPLP